MESRTPVATRRSAFVHRTSDYNSFGSERTYQRVSKRLRDSRDVEGVTGLHQVDEGQGLPLEYAGRTAMNLGIGCIVSHPNQHYLVPQPPQLSRDRPDGFSGARVLCGGEDSHLSSPGISSERRATPWRLRLHNGLACRRIFVTSGMSQKSVAKLVSVFMLPMVSQDLVCPGRAWLSGSHGGRSGRSDTLGRDTFELG